MRPGFFCWYTEASGNEAILTRFENDSPRCSPLRRTIPAMTDAPRSAGGRARHWPLPLATAVVALLLVVATLDSSGAVPQLGEGPGLTFDETFNVQMGVYHVRAVREYGLALLHPDSIREVFGNPAYNPDHPPLGRIVLGIAHEMTRGWMNPDVPEQSVCVNCARSGTALAYAATVFLVGWSTSRWCGRAAGAIAAVSVLLMPRLFGHGHLAALESLVNLTYLTTVLWVGRWWSGEKPPGGRAVVVGGVLFGLCLLTKIQAVLLPVPIGLWVLWRWRLRAAVPMLVFGLTGLSVFFAGWPWLWLDPVEHLSEYFGRATDRQTLYCWYMGHKWADVDVPWHYPAIMFAVTVPIGLHLLGLLGVFIRRSTGDEADGSDVASTPRAMTFPRELLLLNVVWPLLFFALPGITVYDGTRLFLMIFPLWAIFVGTGGARLMHWMSLHWSPGKAVLVMAGLLAAQSYGVIAMHPLGLSYYNLLTGGLRGAAVLGFETTYWGDSVTRSLLDDVALAMEPGEVLHVAPVLHPFQLDELRTQSPALRARGIELRPYDDTTGEPIRRVLVIRRRADSWPSLTPAPEGRLLCQVVRDGVQLAGVYELEPANSITENPENNGLPKSAVGR
jgi:hypothetical protein